MTARFYNYLKLVQTGTPYAKRVEQLSSRIFGEVARPTSAKSMKACIFFQYSYSLNYELWISLLFSLQVVQMFSAQPLEQRPDIKNYYPRHVEIHVLMKNLRNYGLFR